MQVNQTGGPADHQGSWVKCPFARTRRRRRGVRHTRTRTPGPHLPTPPRCASALPNFAPLRPPAALPYAFAPSPATSPDPGRSASMSRWMTTTLKHTPPPGRPSYRCASPPPSPISATTTCRYTAPTWVAYRHMRRLVRKEARQLPAPFRRSRDTGQSHPPGSRTRRPERRRRTAQANLISALPVPVVRPAVTCGGRCGMAVRCPRKPHLPLRGACSTPPAAGGCSSGRRFTRGEGDG